MNISIIGCGHVGLVTGVCFAELGNSVICADNDKKKIESLKRLEVPFYEPGLEELVRRNVKEKRLFFTTNIAEAVKNSLVIFICVGTPPKEDGSADLTGVEKVCRSIARHIDSYRLIVEKSTVPIQTGEWIKHTIGVYNKRKVKFDIASNPEFLREGNAVYDFMHPDRIVIGVESKRAESILKSLYKPLNSPIVITDIRSAELIKHASNSFLATKISFINAISRICELIDADIKKVSEGMGLDKRIGREFLNAGLGFGGSCLPKDLDAFIRICEDSGYDFKLLKEVKKINEEQRLFLIKKIRDALWVLKDKRIGVLGLSFKPGTDDMRQAPSIPIIQSLLSEGAKVSCYDPKAMSNTKKVFEEINLSSFLAKGDVKFCKSPYEVAKGSDCLLILTDWDEFKEIDFIKIKRLLRQPVIVDGRNIYDPEELKELGFKYIGMGRKV
jgi:UDPglucose 6-dehydrogenase